MTTLRFLVVFAYPTLGAFQLPLDIHILFNHSVEEKHSSLILGHITRVSKAVACVRESTYHVCMTYLYVIFPISIPMT